MISPASLPGQPFVAYQQGELHVEGVRLADLARPQMLAAGAVFEGAPDLAQVLGMMKERANTVNELAAASMLFFREPQPEAELVTQHITDAIKPVLAQFAERIATVEWSKEAVAAMIKEVLAANTIKMPLLAMPLRLILTGQLQTPAIDQVVVIFGRDTVLARLAKWL